jgi:DNA-binding NarL/FixJ family response regulator
MALPLFDEIQRPGRIGHRHPQSRDGEIRQRRSGGEIGFDLSLNSPKPLHETLSDREYQVMCMIASGKMAKDIAAELSLSVKTISTYRTRILEKMQLKSNAEITLYAIKQGLVN